ncbi:MAG TPA: 50S ribosomal protein L11 methyltransferase [Solirubrobacteraceae bacterium]|nr:50S ribosomal protein L11 methyltransferase [Solirubrobacteraceae bacterium]
MIRLAVRVARERAELVLAELLELAPAGVEEVQAGPRMVEYAVYGPPGELPRLPALQAAAGAALVEVSTTEIPDDWQERWKSFHRPVLIEGPARSAGGPPVASLHVRPPWEAPWQVPDAGPSEVREVVIDPGQAFGTGAHATTRLCLELLLELAGERGARGPLLDVGTGSGVIAIAAAGLGFAPVLAIDNEPESVEAARINALANGASIEVRRLDLRAEAVPWTAGEDDPEGAVLVANLLRPLLLELAAALPRPPAHLIAGGLLTDEADEIAAAFRTRLGLSERERRTSGEWGALWLEG